MSSTFFNIPGSSNKRVASKEPISLVKAESSIDLLTLYLPFIIRNLF